MKVLPSKWESYAIIAFIIPLSFYLLTLNGTISADHQVAFLGLQYAIWKNHSVAIGEGDKPIVSSVDIRPFNGKYYSGASPGLAFVSFPFAVLGFLMDGDVFNRWGNAMLMNELFLAICSSLAALFLYKICRFYAQPLPSLLASITLALGTLLWPMAVLTWANAPSIMFSTIAVYLVLRYAKENRSTASLAIAGLSLGMASLVEYMAALFLPLLLGYLFFTKGKQLGLLIFFATFSIGPAIHLAYNYHIFSNPFFFPEQLKLGAAPTQSIVEEFDLRVIAEHAAYYFISPYRGLLLFSPVLALGMYQLYKMTRSARYRADALLFIGMFLVVLFAYSAFKEWSGGLLYGPRYLLLGIPYLVIPIAILLSENRSTIIRVVFVILFGYSSFIAGAGALASPLSAYGSIYTYQPSEFNIPWLLEGKLDTWWLFRLHITDKSAFHIFTMYTFLLVWSIVSYITFKEYKLNVQQYKKI